MQSSHQEKQGSSEDLGERPPSPTPCPVLASNHTDGTPHLVEGRVPPTSVESNHQEKSQLPPKDEDEEEQAPTSIPRTPIKPQPSPLSELNQVATEFFSSGLKAASRKFAALQYYALLGQTEISTNDTLITIAGKLQVEQLSWHCPTLATIFILLLASSSAYESILDVLEFQARVLLLNNLTMEDILASPSANLVKRFALAKREAINGKVGKVTVLGVSLVDVEMVEREEKKSRDVWYTSFRHSFVIAVGREGFRLYQACGQPGFRFDEYLVGEGSRVRDWNEAKRFVKRFEKLTRDQEKWTPQLNTAYEECFGVDLDAISGKKRQPPMVPVYRPWVAIHEINDVKVEDIRKFTWEHTL